MEQKEQEIFVHICNRYVASIYNELTSLLIMGLEVALQKLPRKPPSKYLNGHIWRMAQNTGRGPTLSVGQVQVRLSLFLALFFKYMISLNCYTWHLHSLNSCLRSDVTQKQHRPLITWLRVQNQLYTSLTESSLRSVSELYHVGKLLWGAGAPIHFSCVNPPLSDFTSPFYLILHLVWQVSRWIIWRW